MLQLSQQDKRWAKIKLGASNLECEDYGCTTTCVSMISDDFGCYKSPGEIAKKHPNYTRDGLFLWKAMDEEFKDKMRFVWRGYGPAGAGKVSVMSDFTPIIKALKNPNQRVTLQVKDGAHWVKLVSLADGDWLAIDPWTGEECNVIASYKNITGYAIFEKISDDTLWLVKQGILEKEKDPNSQITMTWGEFDKLCQTMAKKILEWSKSK